MPSVIRDEHDILAFGLEAARSFGDPGPELIQHTTSELASCDQSAAAHRCIRMSRPT